MKSLPTWGVVQKRVAQIHLAFPGSDNIEIREINRMPQRKVEEFRGDFEDLAIRQRGKPHLGDRFLRWFYARHDCSIRQCQWLRSEAVELIFQYDNLAN